MRNSDMGRSVINTPHIKPVRYEIKIFTNENDEMRNNNENECL